MTGRQVAAFDFDGTITQRDTLLGFLFAVGGTTRTIAALGRHSVGLARGLGADLHRDAAKERVLGRVLRGRSHDELVTAGRKYANALPVRFRSGTLERIAWHRDEGHELVMVSASLVYYLRPLGRDLGFDEVIGVEMEIGPDGLATGRLARPNVRAGEKATRLQEWWGERPPTELWAYGNSSGDEAMLALADHPVWVGPREDAAGAGS